MDEDTIEINSYLIRDRVLYTLLLLYFLFFLIFFICIIKFKSIKNFFFEQENKLPHILPLYSTNKHNQFRYTDLKNHYDSSTEQTSDYTDYKYEDPFVCPNYKKLNNQLKDLKSTKPITALSAPSDILKESDQELFKFQSTTSNQSQADQSSQSRLGRKKKRKCGLKSRSKCLNSNCKKKNYLSKLVCKYYDKLRHSTLKTSSIDQSTDSKCSLTKSKPLKSTGSSDGLNREKALKCYQDFIENRFTKPARTSNLFGKGSLETKPQNEEKNNIKEDLKKLSKEITNNATIMTPKQLKNYEPFKAEIANPIIRPKFVGKDLQKEAIADEPEHENNLEDYNFLRLANEIEQQNHSNVPKKSPKFYSDLSSVQAKKEEPKKLVKPSNSSEDEDKYINEVNLAMNKRTIPDLNKMYREKRGELRVISFEKEDDKSSKTSNDSSLAKDLRKELDEIKEEKAKLLGKQQEQQDKINELSNKINELKETTVKLKHKEEIENLVLDPPMRTVDKESLNKKFKNVKDKIELNELMGDDSHENISPLVGMMKSEMKNLKPIEFKPLQTIYLKEQTKPEELSELKIAKIPVNQKTSTLKSSSPSLKSEQQLFSRNLILKENNNNLINLKEKTSSDSSIESNQLNKDKLTGFFNKLSLNNILNLKDKQIEDGSLARLNITSLDRQDSKDQEDNPVDNQVDNQLTNQVISRANNPANNQKINQVDELSQLKLSPIDKQQTNQQSAQKLNATGKKSKIPTLNDKFKRSKSLSLQKRSLFNKNKLGREDKVDKDLEKMFNMKFKK